MKIITLLILSVIILILFFCCISPISIKTYLYSMQKKSDISDLKKLLSECAQYLNDVNCNYQISDGTLLGIIREGDLIPWDNDIDMIIFEKDEKYFIECMQSRFGKRFHVGKGLHRLFNQYNQYIDFYVYTFEDDIALPKGPFLKFLTKNFKPNKHLVLHKHKKESLLPVKQVEWNNCKLNIPAQPINVLEECYGRDWMIPKKW